MNQYPEIVNSIYDYVAPLRNLLPWCRHPLRKKENEIRPFFIIGSGRSGTTLLRRIIIQGEGVHIPPETYVLGGIIKLFRQNAGMKWDNLVDLMLSKIEYHQEFYTFDIENLRELSVLLKKISRHERSLAKLIDCFYIFHAEKQNISCKVWGDKTPLNTLMIDRIDKVFPKARYIFLIRNPYDVVYSYVKNGLYTDYLDAAERWKVSNEKALSFAKKNKSRVIKIKYEHLANAPEDISAKIFNFLGLEFEKKFVRPPSDTEYSQMGDVEKKSHHYNIFNEITPENIGKGKKNIPAEIVKEIEKAIRPIDKILDY